MRNLMKKLSDAMPIAEEVMPAELQEAFTAAFVAAEIVEGGEDEDAEQRIREAIKSRFTPERLDALMPRLRLLMLWLYTEPEDSIYLQGYSPIDVPLLHPAVYEAAAVHKVPTIGLAKAGPFLRALERTAMVQG